MRPKEHPDCELIALYRRKAMQADQIATAAPDAHVRASWEYVATAYRDLAGVLERRGFDGSSDGR